MEGSARAAGVGGFVTWNGKSTQVRGRTIEYYAMVEAEIVRARGNPFDMLISAARSLGDDITNDAITALASAAAASFRDWRSASWSDYESFLRTPRGLALEVWYCLPDARNGDTVDDTLCKLMEISMRRPELINRWHPEFQKAVDLASGTDELGNLIGLPSNPPTTMTAESQSGKSSGDSLKTESATSTP